MRVAVWVCPYCDGCWLTEGLLGTLRKLPTDLQNGETHAAETPKPYPCPKCVAPMPPQQFAAAHQTLIYRCDTCKGIWLGGSELKTIISDGRQR